jgi:stage II sporulation protein D
MPELRTGPPLRAALALVALALLVPPPSRALAEERAGTGPLRFEAIDGATFALGDGRHHLDTLEFTSESGTPVMVNELGMEDYVLGVAEMPARWHLEALKAQAVAARTYAWYSIRLGSFRTYDICATVACQVFRGADVVLDGGERWREAVEATSGEVLVEPSGAPILARYFSTSGGRTYANEEVFPSSGARPYLVAIDDPPDAVSPYHRWEARFTREEFDTILSRGDTLAATVPIATLERLGDVDDLAARIRVTGQDGTAVEVSAAALRDFLVRMAPSSFPDRFPGPRSDGLRPLPSTVPSVRFLPEVSDDEVVLAGRGWGHGVGLGQYGALGRAMDGATYTEILAAYYRGLRPTSASELPQRIRVGLSAPQQVEIGADGTFRIVADGGELVPRALGRWTVYQEGDAWRLVPPDGHDEELSVAATRRAGAALEVQDAITVETEVNKPVLLWLEVSDRQGAPVLRRALGAADPGVHAATWRYDDASGAPVPAGEYLVVLTAEDAGGATAGTPLVVDLTAAERPDGHGGPVGVPSRVPLVTAVSVLGVALLVLLATNRKERT